MSGQYKITGKFEGSNAYYKSAITTYLSVNPASTPSTTIDTENTEPEIEMPRLTTELVVVVVAAIAVTGVGAYWILKRK